ncbi:MAG: hypothetical protein ABI261_00470 [Ginsengibacter sp.]
MKKNIIYKAGLIILLLLISFFPKSENCYCKKKCEANRLNKINAMQEINTPHVGVAPYYPLIMEI